MTNKNIEEKFSEYVPLPMCLVGGDGKIKKSNPRIGEVFLYDNIVGTDIFVRTGFTMEELIHSARYDEPLIFRLNKKTFKVNVSDAGFKDDSVILYFTDITDFEEMQERYKKEQACYAIINVDNYDELVASTAEENQSAVMSKIDRCIRNWGASVEASVTRYKSHMYMVIFENSYFQQQERSKFPILDEVREVDTEGDFPITLSIGIGLGGQTPSDNDEYASEALDLALARGGDQAVVKEKDNISFYGGKTQTVEKGNKGKSRIIGHALCRLIDTSKNVIIMGHKNPDMDCFGAALGIYRLAKPRNKNTYILIDYYNEALETIYNEANAQGDYDIIKTSRALQMVCGDTLVIVVDTHRPSLLECPELLEKAENVAVIDHHRKGGDFIQNPTLAYTEPYASSASELVTEILQYTIEHKKLICGTMRLHGSANFHSQKGRFMSGNDHDEDPVHGRSAQLAHGNHGDQNPVVRGIDPCVRRQAPLALCIAEFQCAGPSGARLLYLRHLSPARVVIGLIELIEIGIFKGMAVDDVVSFRINQGDLSAAVILRREGPSLFKGRHRNDPEQNRFPERTFRRFQKRDGAAEGNGLDRVGRVGIGSGHVDGSFFAKQFVKAAAENIDVGIGNRKVSVASGLRNGGKTA